MSTTLVFPLPATPSSFSQLRRTLWADVLKLRRTPVLWLALGGGSLPVLLNFLIFYFKGEKLLKAGQNPWLHYLDMSWQTASALLLPLFVVLLTGMVLHLENRAVGWKHLLAQPVSKGAVFGSKLLLLLGLNAVAQLMYLALLLLAGTALGWLRPELHFQQNSVAVLPLLRMLGHTYLSTLGILGVQYAVALGFRSLVMPLAVGMAGVVSALTLLRWEHIDLVPYAAPFRVLIQLNTRAGALRVADTLCPAEWYSLLWLLVGAGVGYAWLRFRPQPD